MDFDEEEEEKKKGGGNKILKDKKVSPSPLLLKEHKN